MMLDRMEGNAELKTSVRQMLASRRLTHSVLLVGEDGLGAGFAARCIAADERDDGPRRLLNFGHTFGHVYEAAGGYAAYTHGEAVAAGMTQMLRWQIAHGFGGDFLLARLERLLARFGLPTAIDCDGDTLRRYLTHDKKAAGSRITVVVTERPGEGRLEELPLESLWEDMP